MASVTKQYGNRINDDSIGTVEWENLDASYAFSSVDDQDATDTSVRLFTGSAVGDNKAKGVDLGTGGDNIILTYGGSSDTWGASLSASDINSSDFGLAFSATGDFVSNYLVSNQFGFDIPIGSTIDGIEVTTETDTNQFNVFFWGAEITVYYTPPPAPPTAYWVGNTGDWDDASNWSETSGGSGGAGVPGNDTDVIFDANSFSADGQTVTLTASSQCKGLDASAIDQTATINVDSFLFDIHGDTVLDSKLTITNSQITLYGTSSFDQVGATFSNSIILAVDSTGNITLASDVVHDNEIYNDGALNTNNFDIQTDTFTNNFKTVNTGTSNITITDSGQFYGGDGTYNKVTFGDNTHIRDSNTIDTVVADPGTTLNFQAGRTQTITNFDVVGESGNLITLRSTNTGNQFTLHSDEDLISVDYVDIQDSNATGADWWAGDNSTDSGNNDGWTFSQPTILIGPIDSEWTWTTSITPKETAAITYTSAWSWSTGISATMTDFYAYASTWNWSTSAITYSESASIPYESDWSWNTSITAKESASLVITSSWSWESDYKISREYSPLPDKTYEYHVTHKDGTYLGTWQDVDSKFSYTNRLNEAPTELNVRLARSPSNRRREFGPLQDENEADILTEDNNQILVPIETKNSVGAGTDVDIDHQIEVRSYYGGLEALQDENSEDILTENGEPILVPVGAPNGTTVYQGFIFDYDMEFGERQGVEVTVAPFSTQADNIVYKNGDSTEVTHNSESPTDMLKSAIDNFETQGGELSYSDSSIADSGTTASYTFRLQTLREVAEKCLELIPESRWSFHFDPSDNNIYMSRAGTDADHTFYLGYQITNIKLKRSKDGLTNSVYFKGGEDSGGDQIYKYYSDPSSISDWGYGLERQTDTRVTTESSADIIGNSLLLNSNEPQYQTEVTINDQDYDIETIHLGEMVGFANFDSEIDDIILQIVALERRAHTVTLTLGRNQKRTTKRIEEIKRNLDTRESADAMGTPS